MQRIAAGAVRASRSLFSAPTIRATRALFAEAQPAAAAKKDGLLTLTFSTPNKVVVDASPVYQIVVSTQEGDMGVLANHSPYLAELKPGVISLYETATSEPTKYFAPGGFLVVEADSSASVTVPEAVPLEDFDPAAVKKALDEATAELAKAKDDAASVEARIQSDVFSAILSALEKK